MELSRFKEAEDAFRICLSVKPDHVQCRQNFGVAHRQAALTDPDLQTKVEETKAKNTPESFFQLALHYKQGGLLDEEEHAYKECLGLDGKNVSCHYGLFQLYSAGLKQEFAEVACKNVLKYGPVQEFPTEYETCQRFLNARSY